ncbi:GNAT family N-acetyltransferase [Falsiphaeobacter marinintestinus]|uniref:GNAT family N-acetyltransferase n=1 Tax=Falsiphaeobacter marinintestinus TaxID=1492905 RepID=UPI0011B5CE9F|nr:GNAT family N-acetyltransferase [Phaeobacter marinintestinus]
MIAATHLKTERLTLRPIAAEDLDAFRAYCLSDRTQFVGGPTDSIRAFEKFAAMAGHWPLRGFGRYVIDLDGHGIGHAGPMQLDDNDVPELTWSLWSKDVEGQGYATEAVLCILDHVLNDLRWTDLIARVHHDNVASLAVARRANGMLDTQAAAPDWLPQSVTFRFFQEAA